MSGALERSVRQYWPSFDPGPCDGVGLADGVGLFAGMVFYACLSAVMVLLAAGVSRALRRVEDLRERPED